MPIYTDPTETPAGEGANQTFGSVGTYQYSGMDLNALAATGATEYTLVTLVFDVSGSVASYRVEMEAALKAVIESLQASPRADNLLIRTLKFDAHVEEEHGFELLTTLPPSRYDGVLQPGGITALFDAAYDGVAALLAEAKRLYDDGDFLVNAIAVVCTDGQDNASRATPGQVKSLMDAAMQAEQVESIRAILVGVNEGYGGAAAGGLGPYLQRCQDEMGFDQYVGVGDATPDALRKLAGFISRSVSSQSQSLGSGGPSRAMTL